MKTVSDQKAWESDMVALGVSRFRETESKTKLAGRFTDTSAGGRLMKVYLSQVSAEIMDRVSSRTSRKKELKLLKGVDCDKMAMFALWNIIKCLYEPGTVQKVAASIGRMVEDELRFSRFEMEAPEYYNAIVRDLNARNSNNYRHRHRVLVSTMTSRDIPWTSWSNETHIGVGSILLDAVKVASDLIEVRRTGGSLTVHPTQDAVDWITKHDDSIEAMLPDRMPCVIPPRDWTDWKTGGFYGNRLSSLTPLVKTRSGQQRDAQGPLLDSAAMPTVLASINAMQRTSWRVNARLLAVLREVADRGLEIGMPPTQPFEIPPAPIPEGKKPKDLTDHEKALFDEWKAEARTLHNMESERKASIMGILRSIRIAGRLTDLDAMWIVYQLDFRNRAYSTTSGVSPQGSDVSKALLQFGEAEPLTESGWYWFRVHGANKYGNDKGSYDERVQWVDENMQYFAAAGDDPLSHTDVWKDADKPWQFLAWCMEYSAAVRSGDPVSYMSRMPIALDGSCNGLQHFSAMLRDPVGGRSVNLVPGDRPSDIYQDVADVATKDLLDRVRNPSDEAYTYLANWVGLMKKELGGKLSRKITKIPVMTLPYGSSLQTCTQAVHAWLLKYARDYFPEGTNFRHSIVMAKIIWDAIGKVVIAARAAMKWIQKIARALAKHDEPLVYVSPIGFPMVQFPPNTEKRRIEAQIGGRVQLQINQELPGIDRFKAASGGSPNLVHECDATHMHMTVERCASEGITHFAMIHDDYGVHARYVVRLHQIIRETFVELHSTPILTDFWKQQSERTGLELEEPPESGDLDLSNVLESQYFFG